MKTLIVYKSKTGFTKKYAEWISEQTDSDIVSINEIKKVDLNSYDSVAFGGSVHASIIGGLSKFKKMMAKINYDKKFIVFATGATPANALNIIETVWNTNLSEDEQRDIPHFYMQGGLSYEKMSFGDKMIMKMFSKMLSKKSDKTTEEKYMAETISKSFDASSKDFVADIVKCLKNV